MNEEEELQPLDGNTETDAGETGKQPTFSIVIAAHDNARELEKNLPSLLEQDYSADFQVVVVDESSTDDTEDVLKILQQKYPNLYCTFIPSSSHYLSRRKLALTVGIKAAKYEWVIFTDAACRANSHHCLSKLAQWIESDTSMVIGYENHDASGKAFRRFYRLYLDRYLLRKRTAYKSMGRNIAFRKELFARHNGFLKNLPYLRGEYDFLVNEYAERDRCAICIDPDTTLRSDEPSRKLWNNDNIFYQETRRHLKRSFTHRLRFDIEQTLLHLSWIASAAATAFGVATKQWIVAGIGGGVLLLLYILRTVFLSKAAKRFSEENLPTLMLPFFELAVVWKNLYFMIRHRLSDKYDFIRR